MQDFPILTIIVLLPLLSGVVLFFLPGDRKKLIYRWALATGLIEFILSIIVYIGYDIDGERYQFIDR